MLRFSISLFVIILVNLSFGDETFDKLFSAGKYKEAIDYADQKLPPAKRNAEVWVKIARANEKSGLIEKALASYMVSWRMNPKHYGSLLGAARIYNKLKNHERAAEMAQKALAVKFTGEASWQYALACIANKKPVEAKKALEKVIATDPTNMIANRELGIIYYEGKDYSKAIPLLKKSYKKKETGEVAYQIGKCYLETKNASSAIEYLKKAITKKSSLYTAGLELARAYYDQRKYAEAGSEYSRISSKVTFTAKDYFQQAKSLEETGNKDAAISAYRSTIKKYGSKKNKESIVSRHKVGMYDLKAKKYSSALAQFKFIVAADSRAMIVEDIYFLLADAYLGMKNRTKAISSLEKAITIDKSNIEAYARLADLYTKAKLGEKARVTYEKMMSLSPNDPKVYLVLGTYNLKARKYSKALDLFVKSNGLKKSPDALEGIALSASKLNQWDKARDAAESAVSLDGNRIDSRKVLADALMRAKSYKEAATHLEVLVKKMASNKKYWLDLANCYEKLNDKKKLSTADLKVIALDKKNSISRMRQAKYLLSKGNKDKAYALFKELSVLRPKDSGVYKNLYTIALGKKDKKNGTAYLKKYVIYNTKDAEAQKQLGDLLYEAKNLNGALVAYRKAIKIDPGIKGFYKRYAEIVIAKGQQAEVIKALTGVIKQGEADFGTYTTLGMIYMKKKQYKSAMDMYQKALMIEPQSTDALSSLADCQARTGDISGAVITYEQAVMMNPKAVNEYKALGNLYSKQGKKELAMKSYGKYLDQKPSDQIIAKKVGDYFFQKKKFKESAKYLAIVKGKAAHPFLHQFRLCESYHRSKNYKQTIVLTEKLVKRKPKLETIKKLLKWKAEAYENTKQNAKALLTYDQYCKIKGVRDADIAYKRAFLREKTNPTLAQQIYEVNVKHYPSDSRNYMQLGLLYSKNKATLAKAAPMLEKAASRAGKDKSLWLQIARIYGKLGKSNKELAAYRKYIEVDPQNLDANIRIGLILMDKGKITEGMVYLETANTFSPNNVTIMVALSTGYLNTNRTQEAINLLQKAKKQKPNDVDLRRNLFKAYSKLGKKKEAMLEIKQLIEVNRDAKLLLLYAEMLMKDGKVKDAENAVEDIMATDPENIDALMMLAKIQRTRKKYNDAIETYKEIVYIDAAYAPALNERAETYLLQSKPQWAERFFDRTLRADPGYGLAELGKAKLAKMRKDKNSYLSHLKKAKQLSPSNPKIKAECKKAGI